MALGAWLVSTYLQEGLALLLVIDILHHLIYTKQAPVLQIPFKEGKGRYYY